MAERAKSDFPRPVVVARVRMKTPTTLSRRSARPRGGFTLIEVMVCIVILSIAISGFVGSLVATLGMNRTNHETVIARQAAQAMLETIQGRAFTEVFAAFNASAADDGGLLTPAFGSAFAVVGLEPRVGDPDGLCGEILFPINALAGPTFLAEDAVDAELGLPRDLDSDGLVDAANHAANYTLLPVRIRVEWRSSIGDRSIDIETILAQR